MRKEIKPFIEEFNLRELADRRLIRLIIDYDLDPCDFAIDWDEGSRKWTLTYDP